MRHERRYFTWCKDKTEDITPTPRVREWLDSFLLNAELYTNEDFARKRDTLFNTLGIFKLAFRLSEQYGNLSYTEKIEERLHYVEKRRLV